MESETTKNNAAHTAPKDPPTSEEISPNYAEIPEKNRLKTWLIAGLVIVAVILTGTAAYLFHQNQQIKERRDSKEAVVPPTPTEEASPKETTSILTPSVLQVDWEKDSGIRVENAGVPCVYKLEDGRYRIYYHGPGGILSAISSDGLNFNKESGVRIKPAGGDQTIVSDPSVVKLPEGGIRMYYKGADGPGGPGKALHNIFSAVSTDGLVFEEEGLRINSQETGDGGWASVPEAIKLPDGKVRVYYVSGDPKAEGGIMSAISDDGLDFKKEEGVRVKSFVDPAVTVLPNGDTLLLAAVLPPPPDAEQEADYPLGIYGFVSKEGLNFEEPVNILQERAIDPAIIQLDNNSYRIFYGSEDEQGSPIIKSATGYPK